jgi:hypothetical protein
MGSSRKETTPRKATTRANGHSVAVWFHPIVESICPLWALNNPVNIAGCHRGYLGNPLSRGLRGEGDRVQQKAGSSTDLRRNNLEPRPRDTCQATSSSQVDASGCVGSIVMGTATDRTSNRSNGIATSCVVVGTYPHPVAVQATNRVLKRWPRSNVNSVVSHDRVLRPRAQFDLPLFLLMSAATHRPTDVFPCERTRCEY